MAGSDEVNSHPKENNDTTRINITGAELQALIDDAVTRTLDRQYNESSDTHSKTLSVARSKPPSKSHESKEDDVHNSSNQRSVPSRQVVLHHEAPLKTCSYKNKSVKASGEGKREREEENSQRSDKKKKGGFKYKKDSEFRKNSSQSNNRPKCSNCRKQHSGKSTIDPRAKLCGICKTEGHKTLDCKELKNATCYNCNEEGHIKTNCPKLVKKHGEARKTNA
ncbi:uncharacterized protein LOC110942694 [Helianthus annuus]|uniref:uncharacterized protein LOC110942694 n=1 Tax=Helianthus annuus TaxID=4232 RepID=UPI000B909E74|nr:uncharacterized protein LOC110942694 [Helianthus annuus]